MATLVELLSVCVCVCVLRLKWNVGLESRIWQHYREVTWASRRLNSLVQQPVKTDNKKHQSAALLAHCGRNPLSRGFPSQRAISNVERISMSCHRHGISNNSSPMMTSSNGNIFRVTGHLCGEFTGPRWIPHTKASDAELWCFLWSASE